MMRYKAYVLKSKYFHIHHTWYELMLHVSKIFWSFNISVFVDFRFWLSFASATLLSLCHVLLFRFSKITISLRNHIKELNIFLWIILTYGGQTFQLTKTPPVIHLQVSYVVFFVIIFADYHNGLASEMVDSLHGSDHLWLHSTQSSQQYWPDYANMSLVLFG